MWSSRSFARPDCPVLALWVDDTRLWAGGPGGLAARDRSADGHWHRAATRLRSVAAFGRSGEHFIAGGVDGIAYKRGPNQGWEAGDLQGGGAPVASMLATETGEVLAGTLGAGVLRSTDHGRTWRTSGFGLPDADVSALAAAGRSTVLAATTRGIYRSTDGGRAWRLAPGSDALVGADICDLPDGSLLAAGENGALLRSTDAGARWTPHSDLPDGVIPTVLGVTDTGVVLLGTGGDGLLRSADLGGRWESVDVAAGAQHLRAESIFAVATSAAAVYVGTSAGLLSSDAAGQRYRRMSGPPVHDHARLVSFRRRVLLASRSGGLSDSGLADDSASDVEQPPSAPPHGTTVLDEALLAADAVADVSITASTESGILRSRDGQHWQSVDVGGIGVVEHLSFAASGVGYAAVVDGPTLARSADAGATWGRIDVPWRSARTIALQATPTGALVATYEPSRRWLRLWQYAEVGSTWRQGPGTETTTPMICLCGDPVAVALGHIVLAQDHAGQWRQCASATGLIARLTGSPHGLIALSTAGVERWSGADESWRLVPPPVADDDAIDVLVTVHQVLLLTATGRLWTAPMQSLASADDPSTTPGPPTTHPGHSRPSSGRGE